LVPSKSLLRVFLFAVNINSSLYPAFSKCEFYSQIADNYPKTEKAMVTAAIEAIAKAGLAKVRSAFFPWQKVSLEVDFVVNGLFH
jgi:hypothetical protein